MKNSLRVCIVCDNFFPRFDGVAYVISNYHKYFLKHAKSLLVVPKIGKKKQCDLKNVHYVPSSKLFNGYVTPYPYSDRKLKKKLEAFKPNIIHIHSPFVLGNYFLKYAKKHHIPCLMTFHSLFYKDFKKIFKSTLISKTILSVIVKTINKVDYLFATSRLLLNEMSVYKIKKNVDGILENGTEFKSLKIGKYDNEVNKKFNISKDCFVCVYIGRIVKYKNLELIIKIARELSKFNSNFKFLICGVGEDLS
jgi:1,2-diacylglycerol 3-alpha-glucosyltransferase